MTWQDDLTPEEKKLLKEKGTVHFYDRWTLWEKIAHWWWFKEIRIRYEWVIFIGRFLVRLYCNRGWHKYSSNSIAIGMPGKMRKVQFLKCIHCNTAFFTNTRAKKRYQSIQEEDKIMMTRMFKVMTKKNKAMILKDE